MNNKAGPLMDARKVLGPDRFAELVLWQVPKPVHGSTHLFKYRLAFVVDGVCVVRYDNEPGKGDHRHFGALEANYVFTTIDQLVADFFKDVEGWRGP